MTTYVHSSKEFLRAEIVDVIGQALQSPNSILFAISGLYGEALAYTKLVFPLFLPSSAIYRLVGRNELRLRKIAWLSPAVGISLLTLAGRVAFDLMPGPFLKGLIYGVHSCAMRILTNIPRCDSAGIITLRKVLVNYGDLPSVLEKLSLAGRDITWQQSEILSSVAFVTASLGLSFFGGFHMITANVIGHVAAAITKVVSARVFAIFAQQQQQEIVA